MKPACDLEALIAAPISPLVSSLDIDQLQSQLLRILGALELIQDIAKHEIADGGGEFLNHVELVASTFADITSGILDGLSKHHGESQ